MAASRLPSSSVNFETTVEDLDSTFASNSHKFLR